MLSHPDIERILFTPEEIRTRVTEVGEQISADYVGREPLMIAVLKGSVMFLADLMRAMSIHAQMDFLSIAPFIPGGEPGLVRVIKDLDQSIEARDVIVVEDIVDTGLTMRYLLRTLSARRPRTLTVCTFLDRTVRRLADVPVKYRCFEIPDRFVVGYGLDSRQAYRNLSFVGVLKSGIVRP